MSEHTAITWCDSTFNPWIGCNKISPACDHCYAERLMDHRMHTVRWGAGQPRKRTSSANWRKPLLWEREHDAFELAHGRRRRVFCASLADVFDNEVEESWRLDLFWLIHKTPHLDWLLLTKRIGNARSMLAAAVCQLDPAGEWPVPLQNVWLGITVVNQAEADRDIPKLLAAPAAKRFLSIEPMLSAIDLTQWLRPGWLPSADPQWLDLRAPVDWVICGGESGPHARPMHPDWVRSVRDQCAAAGVPFHFKQWGEWTPGENVERVRGTVDTAFLWDDEWSIHPLNLATDHGHIDDQPDLYRVGTKAAGRLLDGIEHNGAPA